MKKHKGNIRRFIALMMTFLLCLSSMSFATTVDSVLDPDANAVNKKLIMIGPAQIDIPTGSELSVPFRAEAYSRVYSYETHSWGEWYVIGEGEIEPGELPTGVKWDAQTKSLVVSAGAQYSQLVLSAQFNPPGPSNMVTIDHQVQIGNPPPVAETLEFIGESTINVPIVGDASFAYSARVLDQYGNPFEGTPLITAVSPDTAAVRFVDGNINLASSAQSGTFTLMATHGLLTKLFDVTIQREASIPKSIQLVGSNAISVPGQPGVATETYTATLIDQFGNVMSEIPTLSIKEALTLPSPIALTGNVLSVSFAAKEQTITLQAAYPGVTSAELSVVISKAAPQATVIKILGPAVATVQEDAYPAVNMDQTITYTTEVYDQFGDLFTGSPVLSAAGQDALGITFKSDTLAITPKSLAGILKITASLGSVTGSLDVAIVKAAPVAKRMTLEGQGTLAVPVKDQTTTETYTATLIDQFGALMTEKPVLSIKEALTLPSPIALTGNVLTISSAAKPQTITLQTTYPGATSAELSVVISKAAPQAAEVKIIGPAVVTVQEDAYPAVNMDQTITYTTEVYDQFGDLFTGNPVLSATGQDSLGITFNGDTLAITPNSLAGTVKITATLGSVTGSLDVAIAKAAPAPKRMTLEGQGTLAVPVKDQTTTETYTATLIDQFGALMTEKPVLSIKEALTLPSPIALTGNVLTISSAAKPQTITLQGAYPGATSAELSVVISKAVPHAAEVKILGPAVATVQEDAYPAVNVDQTITYTTEVYDQFGDLFTASPVLSAAGQDALGIAFKSDTLAITPNSLAGTVKITATLGTITDTLDVVVAKVAPAPKRMTLEGQGTLAVPVKDQTTTETYTATLIDQFGAPMTEKPVLSIKEALTLPSPIALAGNVLTISSAAKAQTITLQGTYPGASAAELSVVISKAAPQAAVVKIFGPAVATVQEDAYPAVNMNQTITYTTEVYDQFGDLFTASPVLSAAGQDALGIKFKSDTLAITPKSLAGTLKITATLGTITETLDVVIVKAAPAPKRMTLEGQGTLAVPVKDQTTTETYTATLIDQFGALMTEKPVLSITEAFTLPSPIALTGNVLTISSAAKAQTITLQGTYPGASAAELSVVITKAAPQAAVVKILGPAVATVQEDAYPAVNMDQTITYTTEVYDQFGDLFTASPVLTAAGQEPLAMTFKSDALVITPKSLAGTLKITATLGSVTSSLDVVIAKAAPAPKRMTIEGINSVLVPITSTPEKASFKLVVIDQFGEVIKNSGIQIKSSVVEGTTFDAKTGELQVSEAAPHGYVVLEANSSDISPVGKEAQAAVSAKKVIYLLKSVQVSKDDITNQIIGANQWMEYSVVNQTAPATTAVWTSIDLKNPPKIAGNTSVKIRYGTTWPTGTGLSQPVKEDGLTSFSPSEAVTLNYSVLPPAIQGVNVFERTTEITIVTNEDAGGMNKQQLTNTLYSTDDGVTWTVYSNPFRINRSVILQAKTITNLNMASSVVTLANINESLIVKQPFTKTLPEVIETPIGNTPSGNASASNTTTINPPVVPQGNLTTITDPQTPLGALSFDAYTKGYQDGNFKPKKAVTRAEFAAMLTRVMRLEVSDTNTGFKDVPSTIWYAGYIKALKNVGIIKGNSNGTFKPNALLTRAEFASLMANYFVVMKRELASSGAPYADIKGHWAFTAINKLFNSGIMEGLTGTAFKPNSPLTREEIVIMLNRASSRPMVKEPKASFKDVAPSSFSFGDIESATQNISSK